MSLIAAPEASCRACGKSFLRRNTLHTACSPRCAIKAVRQDKHAAMDERRATREKLVALKPRSKWMAEAQQAFNAWIRLRDADKPCVSCGRHHDGQWHAGHYLTVGARPELRFDPLNVHKQCQPCNAHLHGNLILYRVELIQRIGIEAVEKLEGPHPPAKWSIDELKCIRDGYRIAARELMRPSGSAAYAQARPPPASVSIGEVATAALHHPTERPGVPPK